MHNENNIAKIMNTTEQWTRWEPAQGLAQSYYIDSISNEVERIIYTDANPAPLQDLSDSPEYMHEILSGSVLEQESWESFVVVLSEANNRQKKYE